MPSFTRRIPSTTLPPPSGTHPSPSLSSLNLLPTGLPSLDDLLGGGLPLGSILLVLAPDSQSAWSKLIERYWIAQGLISGQSSVLVGGDEEIVKGCMWAEKGWKGDELSQSETEGEGGEEEGEGKKIAWRYERMGKFRTTVGGNGSNLSLTNSIPQDVLQSIHKTGQQSYINLDDLSDSSTTPSSSSNSAGNKVNEAITKIYEKVDKADKKRAGRITIHELGGLEWGDEVTDNVHRFVHSLRSIIRNKPISALITVPPHFIAGPSQESFVRKLSWLVDASVELKGFADDPTLPPLFPTTHGLLTLHSYPTSHTLLPSTLKHSTLLGVSQGSDGGGGAGENNLGFRLKRKKFVIETVHLGVEGGVGERSTGPPDVTAALSGTSTHTHTNSHTEVEGVEKGHAIVEGERVSTIPQGDGGVDRSKGPEGEIKKKSKPRARVRFGGEEEMVVNVSTDSGKGGNGEHDHGGHDHHHDGNGHEHEHQHKKESQTQRVQVRHDRPDLYEF
uniref:Elongator complex protein 4 n=1 Tax=Kwoniella bestiolae CBS 10118 TaxID=1296100 RepID=A0A1B9GES6_9TREE|nr:elongator complex protein 4 [Kwoniella bestiolae CBS 10118]OCF29461.1 elongator complex protein 4 [Kwoniella bestiolae CBS 10118]